MTAKEYLQQIYILQGRISRLQRLRSQIRDEMYSVSSPALDKDNVSTSKSNPMERMIAKVDSIERDIVTEMLRLMDRLAFICKQIEALEDERYRKVLYERYIMYFKWEQIATDLSYSLTQVYRLHGEALKAFAAQYGSKW